MKKSQLFINSVMRRLHTVAAFLVLLLVSSCQEIDLGNNGKSADGEAHSVMFTSRSDVAGTAIPSPLSVYAVDGNGLVASKVRLADGEVSGALSLVTGSYMLYGVACADSTESETADGNVITAEAGSFAQPVMQCSQSLVVESDNQDVVITLSYAVASVDVTLSDIPDTIASVYVEIAWQSESMTIKRTYGGSTVATLECKKQADGTWKSDVAYMFPGTGEVTTLTITHVSKNGYSKGYTATYGSPLKAATPYHFRGTYEGIDNKSLSFSVIAGGWEEDVDETLDITPAEGTTPTPSPSGDEVYEVEEMDGHVLIKTGEHTGLLFSKEEWNGLSPDNTRLQQIAAEYDEEGETGWSVPTREQMELLKSHYGNLKTLFMDVNKMLSEVGGTEIIWEERLYLCGNADSKYNLTTNNIKGLSNADITSSSFYLRLVKSVTF